jgi:predicted amidohydrolase
MKIATSAYPLEQLTSWAQYEDKLSGWLSEAAEAGADLAVFPEYAAMELATLAGSEVCADLQRSIDAVSDLMPEAVALHSRLAQSFGLYVLAGSAPVRRPAASVVNRAYFLGPQGQKGHQDKQLMTRFENEVWGIAGGEPLQVFDTDLGKIGILICYDSEFPLLGRALHEAEIILVPSVTETASGYARVRIGAQARALENQCVTVMSSIVGGADWSEALGETYGAGGIFGPPDTGFPATGVIARGTANSPGWTFGQVDPAAIAHVRQDGQVLNRRDWAAQPSLESNVTITPFRTSTP